MIMKRNFFLEIDFIFKYRTLYPYGLNTRFNNLNVCNIGNIYTFLYEINSLIKIQRGHRGRHINKFDISNFVPRVWIRKLEDDFINNQSIEKVKSAVFFLKISTFVKTSKSITKYKFSDQHFKDLLHDLIYCKTKQIINNKEKLYFITLFQKKSFNKFNYIDILKNL